MVSAVNGSLREVCSAEVRRLGEKVGQAWRLHMHPQDSTKAAYVSSTGQVKWNLTEIEVPTLGELGVGWAWFVNDLRAFLPAWQDGASIPFPEEPVSQIDADVPLKPISLQAEAADLDLDTHVTPMRDPWLLRLFGTFEPVPDWDDTHAMTLDARPKSRIDT